MSQLQRELPNGTTVDRRDVLRGIAAVTLPLLSTGLWAIPVKW